MSEETGQCLNEQTYREVKMMRKEIVLVLVVAVLILGGTIAVLANADFDFENDPECDPEDPKGGTNFPLLPDGEPLPDGPS